MRGMYVTYVRPLLEYNCEVWSPLYLQDIDRIESVQRKFTKRIRKIRFDDFFLYIYAPVVGTRGNSLKLYPCFASRNVAYNFFGNRVVNFWNSLPDYVVTAPFNLFKKLMKLMKKCTYCIVFCVGGLSEIREIFCPWVNMVSGILFYVFPLTLFIPNRNMY